MLAEHPNSRSTFLVEGRAPPQGQVFRNPDLSRSLRRIAEQGRDGYYKGPTAQAIVDIVREQGGAMALEDLAEFQPEWVPRFIYYEAAMSLPRVALAYLEAETLVRLPVIGVHRRRGTRSARWMNRVEGL